MADANIKDFYERVGRLNKAHAQGYGFEGTGVLGRAYFRRPQPKKRLKLVVPIALVLMAAFALKGSIHFSLGAQSYNARVAEMQNGAGFDRLGAVLMTPDRVTLWVSETLRRNLQTRG